MNNICKKICTLMVSAYCILAPLESKAEDISKNDIVLTKAKINQRLNNDTNSYVLTVIPANITLTRYMSLDNWSLVEYDGALGFVSNDYIEETGYQAQSNYKLERCYDIVSVNTGLNYRKEPNTDSEVYSVIKKGERIQTISKTKDDWYLIIYDGKLGYIKKEYTTSIKEQLNDLLKDYENVDDIRIEKVAYSKKEQPIFDSTGNVITGYIDKYEEVKVIREIDNKALIFTDDQVGFVNKNGIRELDGLFITISINNQRLRIYYGKDNLFTTYVVTGKESTPTPKGYYLTANKRKNRLLKGADYEYEAELWVGLKAPDNADREEKAAISGVGIHSSDRKEFGETIYIRNGSHGCINTEKEEMRKIYELVKLNIPTIIY